MRYLNGIFAILILSLTCLANVAKAQEKQLPLTQNAPPKIFDYTPRKPSFSLPQYYYPCRQLYFYFPTNNDFSHTNEAKKDINKELDFIYSNGDSVPNNLGEIYARLIDNIALDLDNAKANSEEIENILRFERAINPIEECGRALGQWEANAPKLRAAFSNYYLKSPLKEKFQSISQSKFSKKSLLLNEAFLSNFKRSNFISPELSASLTPYIEAANARLIDARNQYLGTYFAQGVVDKDKCIIEDDEVRLRGRIDTYKLYPHAAIRKEIEGEVVLKLNVDSNGKATNVEFGLVSDEVFRSEEIISAFYNADFWPKIESCVTMPGIATQKLVFRFDQ